MPPSKKAVRQDIFPPFRENALEVKGLFCPQTNLEQKLLVIYHIVP